MKNGSDSVLLIFKNCYTSATGAQELVSTPAAAGREDAGDQSMTDTDTSIERVLQRVGVNWLRTEWNFGSGPRQDAETEQAPHRGA